MRTCITTLILGTAATLALAGCDSTPAAPSTTRPPSSPTTPARQQPSGVPSASKTAAPAAKSAGPQLIEAKDYTGVILPYDYPWSRGKKRWAANGEAVAKAEQCIARELPKMKASPDYQEDKVPLIVNRLNEYRRQYLGYTDEKGRHMLWVNFFLEPHGQEDDWQTSLVLVKGGGHGFFNVTADVAGGTCGELRINSPR